MTTSNSLLESENMPTMHILDACVFGIVIVNEKLEVVAWNSWFEKHSAINKADAIGQDIFSLFKEMTGGRLHAAISSAILQGNSSYLSQALNRMPFPLYEPSKKNEPVQQSICVNPIYFPGNENHCIIQIEDVTPSVNREKKLREMKAEAVHDKNVAENLAQMKSSFLSTVNHELRTPLTSMSGSLSLIKNGLLGEIPEEAMKMIELTCRNAERLILLVNDILDIDKIESGVVTYDIGKINVAELLSQAVEENQGLAIKLGIEFKITPCDDSLFIEADASRLIQVITNLLSNAAKFSPKNATVNVFASTKNNKIRISVADSGPGISKDFQDTIFDKFTQDKKNNNIHPGGTGLGLAICKKILQQQGAEIDFICPKDGGTEFFFYFDAITP